MKAIRLLGITYLLFQLGAAAAPELVQAQGIGLRCNTPRCNYDTYDSRGRWLSDGRHDPSSIGYGAYGYGTSFGGYNQGGTTIINPAPGTALKVEKKSGGFLCSLLNFCDEEKVDFSTAMPSGYQNPPQQQTTAPSATQAPVQPKLAESKTTPMCETTCVRIVGGNSEANLAIKDIFRRKKYTLTEEDNFDYEVRVADKVTENAVSVKVEIFNRQGKRLDGKESVTRFEMVGVESALSQSAAIMLAAIDAVSKLKF